MGHKKARVTDEMVQNLCRLRCISGLNRKQVRALERKGIIEKKRVRAADGSIRYRYRMAGPIHVKLDPSDISAIKRFLDEKEKGGLR